MTHLALSVRRAPGHIYRSLGTAFTPDLGKRPCGVSTHGQSQAYQLQILNISSQQTPRGCAVPHSWLDWKAQSSLTMNSRQRAMGPKSLIQTEPLSLLGCSDQQQGWTWSDGPVPAKHFGTCRDMKGSNETHFTIHWPRALSRQRFLPNIPAIYPMAQVCNRVPPTSPWNQISDFSFLGSEKS